jgi:hypothetical protein
VAVVSLIAASGCGGGNPPAGAPSPGEASSTAEAKVTGTVKIHGLAMSGGKITFDPSNPQRKNAQVRAAEVHSDGSFEITTLVGPNTVRISGPAVKKDPGLGTATKTVDVTSGENRIELSFPD